MRVELLFFDECPNWQTTLDEIHAAMAQAGCRDAVDLVKVSNQEEAERLRFPGSPTVRVSGRDIESDAPTGGFGLECRIYWDHGRARGTPSRELLLQAIRSACRRADDANLVV